MLFSASSLAAVLLAIAIGQVQAVDKTRDPDLVAKLNNAATQLDRLTLLPGDKSWSFDFTAQPFYTFAPGGVINMNVATFPAAKGNGMTMAMLNLGPCSMLPPHYHPRAANYVVAILGNTTTYMFEENGAQLVTEKLTPGKATVFPQASMHMMVNTGCTNAQLVSALNSEDAGTQNVGNVLTNGFPADLVNAAFGSSIANVLTAAKMDPVGTGANWGTQECLQRCGIPLPKSNGTYGYGS